MKTIRKLCSLILCISLVFGLVPGAAFAASDWSVSYDPSSYDPGSLSVELFSAEQGIAPRVEWTDLGSSIKADKTAASLFGSGDYYAVVQYVSQGSYGGGYGGGSSLSDAEIEAEFARYLAALYPGVELPITVPDGFPDISLETAEDFYNEMYSDEDFLAWCDENGCSIDDWDTLTEMVYSWYETDDPDEDPADPDDIRQDIIGEVTNVLGIYCEYCGADEEYVEYLTYPLSQKRSIIEMYIAYPSAAPEGYTPPSAGSGSGSSSSGSDAGTYVVVKKLSASEKTNGFAIGSSFFDSCAELSITADAASQAVDVYWVSGDLAIPSAIDTGGSSDDEGDDYDFGMPDMGEVPDESENLTGSVSLAAPYYVVPGTYLVVRSDSASSSAGGSEDAVIDWEQVTVTAGGGSVDFTQNRSLVTVSASVSGLNTMNGLGTLSIGTEVGGSAKAHASAGLVAGIGTDDPVLKALKIKPGSYDSLDFSVTKNIDESTSVTYSWEKPADGINAGASFILPSPNTSPASFTSELKIVRASDGSEGPFAPGEALMGVQTLSAGDFMLTGVQAMHMDMAAIMAAAQSGNIPMDAIRAVWLTISASIGGESIASGQMFPMFSFTAPNESKTVTAVSSVKLDGAVDLEFTSSAVAEISGSAVDVPPAVPSGLTAQAQEGSISFSWTANTEDDLAGYKIYRVDSTGRQTLLASPAKTATTASVDLDRDSWGSAPWYFALSAVDAAGNASALTDTVSVSDPRIRFSGSGSFTAKDGTIENGRFTTAEDGSASLAFSFTPSQSVAEADKPDFVSLTVKYKDISGSAKESTVSLAKTASYAAEWPVPSDAATLVTADLSFELGGEAVLLQTLDLGALAVCASSRVIFPESYQLASEFTSVTVIGTERVALTRGNEGWTGVIPRSVLAYGALYIGLGDMNFSVSGVNSYRTAGTDTFAIPVSAMPNVVKLQLTLTEGVDLAEVYAELEAVDDEGDDMSVSSDAERVDGNSFWWYFSTGDMSAPVSPRFVIDSEDSLYRFEAEEGASLLEGINFVPGAIYEISGRLTIALESYMFLDIMGGPSQNAPLRRNTMLDFTDSSGHTTRVSYLGIGVADTSELTEGETYTVTLSYNRYFEIDPITVTAVKDGSNHNAVPCLKLMELAQVQFYALFETDLAGVPGTQTSGAKKVIPLEYDVYYKNTQTGQWTLLEGNKDTHNGTTARNDEGVCVDFTSVPLRRDLIDTTAGLKIVFGTQAQLTHVHVNDQFTSSGYFSNYGDYVSLMNGQEFYTVSAQGENTLTATGLTSTVKDNSGAGGFADYYLNEYTLQYYAGGVNSYGSKAPALVSGLVVSDVPRVELNVSRRVPQQQAVFVLRDSSGVCRRYLAWITVPGILTQNFTALPYGTYDILMYIGPDQDQWESQFMDGDYSPDTPAPAGVCGTIVTGKVISESDACVRIDLPAEPEDSSIKGIQGVTVSCDKSMALVGDRISFTVHFTATPGGSEADRTLDLNSLDRFVPDGVSATLVLEDGSRIQPESINAYAKLVVPSSDQTIRGTLILTGKINNRTDCSHARLRVSIGNTDGSWDYCSAQCWGIDFTATSASQTHTTSAWIQGRAASGSSLTIRVTSKTDPTKTADKTITVPQYGYWKAALDLPVTDQRVSEDFYVEVFGTTDQRIWPAAGEENIISFISDNVLPSRIVLSYVFNGAKIDISSEPGAARDFAALNKAILTFGGDYETTGVLVRIYFDDTDPDEWGMTDARRVIAPALKLTYSSRLDPIYLEFYAMDRLSYDYNNEDLGISISNTLYSTSYYTIFPATKFGKMGICYDLLPCKADLDIGEESTKVDYADFVLNALGSTASEANAAADALRGMMDYTEAQGGTVTYEKSVSTNTGNISFEAFKKSDFEELEEGEEDALVIPAVSGNFKVDGTVRFTNDALTASQAAQKIAARKADDPEFSKDLSGQGSFISYMDSDCYLTFKQNADGTVDMSIVSKVSIVMDMSQIPDAAAISSAATSNPKTLGLLRGEGSGAPANIQMSSLEMVATVNSFATDATMEVLNVATSEGGDIFARVPAGAATIQTVQGVTGNVAAAAGLVKTTIDASNTMTDGMGSLNAKTNDYIRRLKDYQGKLERSMSCSESGSGKFDAISKMNEARYKGEDQLRAAQTEGNHAQLAIALGAALPNALVIAVPIPGISTATGVLTGLWAKEALKDQEFNDARNLEQAYQRAENEIYQAMKSTYSSQPCEPEDPEEEIKQEFNPDGKWGKGELSADFGKGIVPKTEFEPERIIDPSGTVYEALLSNPLEGVEVSIEYRDGDEWKLWEAAPDYNYQEAVIITNASGFYRWDVPGGKWRVKYYKEGYNGGEPIYSKEMDVPPVWLDVNQNMTCEDPAEAEAKAGKDGITVEFSRPVKAEDVSATAIQLLKNGQPIEAELTLGKAEEGLIRSLTLTAAALDKNADYTVKAEGIRTYAGTESSFEVPVDLSALPAVEKVVATLEDGTPVTDGMTLPYGSKLVLTAPTEGSHIYYTTNGVCPRDDAANRIAYEEPITLTEATYFFRIRAYMDGVWSDGLPLHLTVTAFLLGDVNGDREVDANDLTALSRHVAKIETITDPALLSAADVNGSGEADSDDLTMLSRYVAHIISAFE